MSEQASHAPVTNLPDALYLIQALQQDLITMHNDGAPRSPYELPRRWIEFNGVPHRSAAATLRAFADEFVSVKAELDALKGDLAALAKKAGAL